MLELPGITYRGAPLDDVALLERLPADLAQLLARRNGVVALRGGLHVRGACVAPAWHSLRRALEGDTALHLRFPALLPADIPFAQDAYGNQFVLRDGEVRRLAVADAARGASGIVGALHSLGVDLTGFLDQVARDPIGYLDLEPLLRFTQAGGLLAPGELLASDPARAVPADELLISSAPPSPERRA